MEHFEKETNLDGCCSWLISHSRYVIRILILMFPYAYPFSQQISIYQVLEKNHPAIWNIWHIETQQNCACFSDSEFWVTLGSHFQGRCTVDQTKGQKWIYARFASCGGKNSSLELPKQRFRTDDLEFLSDWNNLITTIEKISISYKYSRLYCALIVLNSQITYHIPFWNNSILPLFLIY